MFQDLFLALMIIASQRDKRFIGIVAACLQGVQVDGYLAANAFHRAVTLNALPSEEVEMCIQASIVARQRSKSRIRHLNVSP